MAEMVTYLPISSPFIRFAGRYVDEAFGVAAGYNFFIFEAAMVPFEIVACNFIIHYWSDVVPAAAIIAIVLVIYAYVLVPLTISAASGTMLTGQSVSSISSRSNGMANRSSGWLWARLCSSSD